jgi:hypothetical protein
MDGTKNDSPTMVCFRNHTQEATEAMSTTDNRRVARMLTTLCLQRHIHRLRLVFVQNVFGLVIAIDMATRVRTNHHLNATIIPYSVQAPNLANIKRHNW